MIRSLLLGLSVGARVRMREFLDGWTVAYLLERPTLDRGLGLPLLEKLAERYGAKLEIVDGPGS